MITPKNTAYQPETRPDNTQKDTKLLRRERTLGPCKIGPAIAQTSQAVVYEVSIADGRTAKTSSGPLIMKTARASDDSGQRLRSEAAVLRMALHPAFPEYITEGEDKESDLFYLVMEKLEGSLLYNKLRSSPFGLLDAIDTLIKLGAPLSALHQAGLIHRDLKPGNIFITAAGPRPFDLGLVFDIERQQDAVGGLKQGTVAGTPGYLAPEQVLAIRLDQRTDIYSLGLIAYEMIAGDNPMADTCKTASYMNQILQKLPLITKEALAQRFSINSDGEQLGSFCEYLNEFFASATAKNPSQRFPDIVTFQKVLINLRKLLIKTD